MANLIEQAKQNADALLQQAYLDAAKTGELPEGAVLSGTVEIPKDVQNGDFAANHAMVCARSLHMGGQLFLIGLGCRARLYQFPPV